MTLEDTVVGVAKVPLMDLLHPSPEPFDVPVIAIGQVTPCSALAPLLLAPPPSSTLARHSYSPLSYSPHPLLLPPTPPSLHSPSPTSPRLRPSIACLGT